MKSILLPILIFFSSVLNIVSAQTVSIDKVKFFEDTSVLKVIISSDLAKVFKQKDKVGVKFPASISVMLPDSTKVDEPIVLETRGHFRKGYCYIPPLKIVFKNKKTSVLKPLGSLKLVNQCKTPEVYQQYLLSEMLIYKMYNLLTDKSFRVRLLNLELFDSTGKKKPIHENAFLLEDAKDLAKRNNCTELKNKTINYNETDRRQMTMMTIFEYMIGNTDWAVSVSHNMLLLSPKDDSITFPYVVPYDFDNSGFVNADYANPAPNLNISSVRERLYRGFIRTMNEINETLNIYKKQEQNIYSLINNCNLLTSKTKKSLTGYLDSFFIMIKNPNEVYKIFVENARTE